MGFTGSFRASFFLLWPLALLTVLFPHAAISQRQDIVWGNDAKAPPRSLITEVVGVTPHGFYALRVQEMYRLRPYLEFYDESLTLRRFVEIDLKHTKKAIYRTFEKILYTGAGLFLFSSYVDEFSKENSLYVESLDMQTLQGVGDSRKILSIFRNRLGGSAFRIALAKDSSKVLAFAETLYGESAPKQLEMAVFDASMQTELWHRNVVLNGCAEGLYDTENVDVDGLGNAYVLGRRYFDKRIDRRKGRPNYEFNIIAFKHLGQDSLTYTVRYKDLFITDLAFRIAPDGDFVCAGFYSNNSSRSTIRGTFSFYIDAEDGQLYRTGNRAFDEAFLAQFMSPRKARRGRELYEYALRDLIVRNDGGAVLVAEQYFMRQIQTSTSLGTTNTGVPQIQYYYNDIIVVSIAPDGRIEWNTKIPKRQQTANDNGYFSSYAMAAGDNQLYFIFNDHIRNLTQANPDKLRTFNGRKSVVMIVTVEPDGTLSKKPLFSNREQNILTRPKIARQMTRHVLMLYGEAGRRYKFGRMTL